MKVSLNLESSPATDSLVESLVEVRDQLFADTPVTKLPDFVTRPEVQLTQYATHRGASTLGRLFRIANGLHAHLDAVVVLGCDDSIAGIRAITDACCDPYHNELSRADRGSKPRMYFAGNGFDNDHTASLLQRLRLGGDTDAQQRFAIIAIGYPNRESEMLAALPLFLGELTTMLGDHADAWLPRLVVPIVGRKSCVPSQLTTIPGLEPFELGDEDDPLWNPTSPVGLLPAAFLGLDCMKFLEGAYAVTEQFRTEKFDNNIVLRYAASNRSSDNYLNGKFRVRNWSSALDSLLRWHQRSRHEPSFDNATAVHNWSVRKCRTDSLNGGTTTTEPRVSFDQMNESAIVEAIRTSLDAGETPTRLTLPEIDTFAIGQLIQLLLLGNLVNKTWRRPSALP